MESVRHTGATVLGFSIVDRQLIDEKQAAGEITKVFYLFLSFSLFLFFLYFNLLISLSKGSCFLPLSPHLFLSGSSLQDDSLYHFLGTCLQLENTISRSSVARWSPLVCQVS